MCMYVCTRVKQAKAIVCVHVCVCVHAQNTMVTQTQCFLTVGCL